MIYMIISMADGIIRLCVAVLLGGIIGYERQAKSKAAGFRTHMLVCVGSCLCMIISINIAMEWNFVYGYTNADPERIAAQVISGVGFLGAGTILANQKERNVRGLTTAASIWAVAAIGLGVGAGYWEMSAAATMMIFIILTIFMRMDTLLNNHYRKNYMFHIVMKNTVGQSRRLGTFFQERHLKMESFQTVSAEEGPSAELKIDVSSACYIDEGVVISELLALKGITMAELKLVEKENCDKEK